jgi:Zn-dependent peptidase ImmA (M78 family)
MLNPDRVELVRRRFGLTKSGFAAKLGVDRKAIQRFDSGEYDLPEHGITRLCEFSGFPMEYFKLPSPEFPDPDGVSFRSLRSLTASKRDAAMAAGAIAFEFDDWIGEEYQRPDHDLIQVDDVTPAAAATQLRAHWGMGLRPISNVINLLEAHGVRVFSLVEDTRHLDAYSLWRNDKPYVFLNTTKTAERSRHDACHELGHLIMHRHKGSTHPTAEDEANAFASAFLMPPDDLLAETSWGMTLHDLIKKKKRWGVSVSSLNYALHKNGRLSDWSYRSNYISLNKYLSEIGGAIMEPESLPHETSQVWEKIFRDLWNRGLPLSRIAAKMLTPERQLNDLLFGIAGKPPIPTERKLSSV